MNNKPSIKETYRVEIDEINFLLNEIGSGRIYGFPGNCTPADDELNTNVDKLSKKLHQLLDKIENEYS